MLFSRVAYTCITPKPYSNCVLNFPTSRGESEGCADQPRVTRPQSYQAVVQAENRDLITPLHLAAHSNSGSLARDSAMGFAILGCGKVGGLRVASSRVFEGLEGLVGLRARLLV